MRDKQTRRESVRDRQKTESHTNVRWRPQQEWGGREPLTLLTGDLPHDANNNDDDGGGVDDENDNNGAMIIVIRVAVLCVSDYSIGACFYYCCRLCCHSQQQLQRGQAVSNNRRGNCQIGSMQFKVEDRCCNKS